MFKGLMKFTVVGVLLGVGGYLLLEKNPTLKKRVEGGIQSIKEKISPDDVDMVGEDYLAGEEHDNS